MKFRTLATAQGSKTWGLRLWKLIWRIAVFFLAMVGLGIPCAFISITMHGEFWGIGFFLMALYVAWAQGLLLKCGAKLFGLSTGIVIGWLLIALVILGALGSIGSVCQRYAVPELFGIRPPTIPFPIAIVFVALIHLLLIILLGVRIANLNAERCPQKTTVTSVNTRNFPYGWAFVWALTIALIVGSTIYWGRAAKGKGDSLRNHAFPDAPEQKPDIPAVSFTRIWDGGKNLKHDLFLEVARSTTDVDERLTLLPTEIRAMNEAGRQLKLGSKWLVPTNASITPLTVAVQQRWNDVVEELLTRGANPNAPLPAMILSPLQQAIVWQDMGMVSNLLSHGADPNRMGVQGTSVSMAVVFWGEKTRIIMEHVPQIGNALTQGKSIRPAGETIVQSLEESEDGATDLGRSMAILEMLVEAGGKVNLRNPGGFEPLVSAFIAKRYDAFVYLLAKHPQPEHCLAPIPGGGEYPLYLLLASIGDEALPYLQEMQAVGVDIFTPYQGISILSIAEGNATKAWLQSIREVPQRATESEEKIPTAHDTPEEDAIASQIQQDLEKAKNAESEGNWQEVVAVADEILVLDQNNIDAKKFKAQALEQLKPRIHLTATLNGTEVPATVTKGLKTSGKQTPLTVNLSKGEDYAFVLTYKKDEKRFVGRATVTAKDQGLTEVNVVLVEWREPGTERTITLPGGVPMEMVWCPPGSFLMGSPADEEGRDTIRHYDKEKQHEETIEEGFWIAKFEVTQEQWKTVMSNNPSGYRADNLPVEAPHEDCKLFCKKAGRGLELPSEKEWEYACRAGSKGPFAGTGSLDDMGWYRSNSDNWVHQGGLKEPNAWGLYDMHGNVEEFCTSSASWFQTHFLRGGRYWSEAMYCRSASCDDFHDRGGLRPVIRQSKETDATFQDEEQAPNLQTPLSEKAQNLIPGTTKTIVLPGGATMEMVWCPPGSFMMGSHLDEVGRNDKEMPHKVTLTQGFWIAKYEVTQAQWKSVMWTNPSRHKGDNLPVENVSRNDAYGFCHKAGFGLQLPTEAQWEYACRAGNNGAYAGNGSLKKMGWYEDNSGGKSHPVGQKMPNAWGIYDMHGNVEEWCKDNVGDYPRFEVINPEGSAGRLLPSGMQEGVCRGGGWKNYPDNCRSATRHKHITQFYRDDLGFRPISPLP